MVDLGVFNHLIVEVQQNPQKPLFTYTIMEINELCEVILKRAQSQTCSFPNQKHYILKQGLKIIHFLG